MKVFKNLVYASIFIVIQGCVAKKDLNTLHIATSAEYPPFEYMEGEEIKGYDIDLARLIAKKLGKQAVFENMQFSTVLPALSSGQADMAISTITVTPERAQHFSFSDPYYHEHMAIIFKKSQPFTTPESLCHHKIAAQLGTTMAIWLQEKSACSLAVLTNTNPLAIEALKAGQVDGVLMDGSQAPIFGEKNEGLSYAPMGTAAAGYAMVFPKDDPLLPKVNEALKQLKAEGALQKLSDKWLGGKHE